MSNKKCWIDVETGGLDYKKSCILTMGVLIDIDGEVIEELEIKMRPEADDLIDPRALKVNGITKEDYESWESQLIGYAKLMSLLTLHINKFDKNDKFIFCAYNATFDDGFLRQLFLRMGNKYYGSMFFWPKLDVQTLLAMKIAEGLRLPNYKLTTVCEYFDIPFLAHSAIDDIKATKILYYKLREDKPNAN